MKKRIVLFFGVLVAVSVIVLAVLFFGAGRPFWPQPSIILISIDTLRADHLGCYGYPLATSPHIDRFSADAVLFEDVLSQSPTTAPSHMTIFTGLMPGVHGILDSSIDILRQRKLCANIPTLAELLKRNGYLTAGFYEKGALWPELGFGRGFDIYKHMPFEKNFHAIHQWLVSAKKKNQPYFLFLHHYICHDPYLRAPQETIDKFLLEKAEGLLTGLKDISDKGGYDVLHKAFWKNADAKNPAHQRHVMAFYDAAINYSDLLFGELIEMLKDEGVYDRSVIILLSDHGEEFGEHSGWMHGRLFGEQLCVPLMIKFPRHWQAGRRISEPTRLIDVVPTLFDFLGIRKYQPMQGVSVMPLVRNKKQAYRPLLASYSSDLRRIRLLRDGFVYCHPDGVEEEVLFDRHSDPVELVNLASTQPMRLREMRGEADAAMAADEAWRSRLGCGNEDIAEPGQDTVEALKSLGYLQ